MKSTATPLIFLLIYIMISWSALNQSFQEGRQSKPHFQQSTLDFEKGNLQSLEQPVHYNCQSGESDLIQREDQKQWSSVQSVQSFSNFGQNLLQQKDYKQKIPSADHLCCLSQSNHIDTQATIQQLCLKDKVGSRQISIIHIKNDKQPKRYLCHLLIDTIEIITREFKQQVSLYLPLDCIPDSFLYKQIILVFTSSLVQQQFHAFFKEIQIKQQFYLQKCLNHNYSSEYQIVKAITIQQLQVALYSSLKKFEVTRSEQYPIIHKLRLVYAQMLEPCFFLKNKRAMSAISQLLLQVVNGIEIYGPKCQEILTRIVRLFEYKQFNRQNVISLLCRKLKTTIDYIIIRLNMISIDVVYSHFKQLIKSKEIKIKGKEEGQFLEPFRLTNNLVLQHSKNSFDEYLLSIFSKFQHKSYRDQKIIKYLEKPIAATSQTIPEEHKNQFNLAIYQITHSIFYNSRQPDFQQRYKSTIKTYFSHIENQQELPNNYCLTCSPFFYQGHSIADKLSSSIPLKSFQTIDKFQQIQGQFLSKSVQFLNHGGGIIVFGVQNKLIDDVVVGNRINEQKKSQIVVTIQNSIKSNIQSLNSMQPSIEVDFALVTENPIKQDTNHQRTKENNVVRRVFLEDIYVTRVKICPHSSAEIYFLRNYQQPKCFSSQKGTVKQLSSRQIARLIKRKIKTFLTQSKNESMTSLPQNFFDHQCKRLKYLQNRIIKSSTCQSIKNKQFIYKQMCLLVAKQKNLPLIKRKLLDKGYKCSIQIKFSDKKFASTKHTSVLYIDLQFEQILKQISFSPDFCINQKALLTIRIQRHLKLQSRNEQNMVTQQFYRNICSWVESDFPKEVIQLYEYRVDNRKQYFFETNNKTICLYLYYLLNHLSQRSSLKQAKGLNKLANEQKSKRWIRLFPIEQT